MGDPATTPVDKARLDPKIVSDAIVAWSGWGETAWPADDEQRVVRRFGPELAEKLMPIVHQLEDEFFTSDARVTAKDLREIGDIAARRFRDLHPELSNDAIEALAWCYTFTYKKTAALVSGEDEPCGAGVGRDLLR